MIDAFVRCRAASVHRLDQIFFLICLNNNVCFKTKSLLDTILNHCISQKSSVLKLV
eukprot:UN23697